MPASKRLFNILPVFLQRIYHSSKNKSQISKWIRKGKPVPAPHAVKQELVTRYRKKHEISTLVESGTYLGDMVWAQQHNFEKIYTIELSKHLQEAAKLRFRNSSHIEFIHGDSGKLMSTLIKDLPEKTLFWLDGHYSGGKTARGDKDCPITDEVKAILSSNIEHVLLIDDARYFIGERDYPTINGLSAYILSVYPNSKIDIENDCIIVELKK
ncbi:hypothetical protein CLV62_10149 [Dysgonomonas alginatilytica]|uniref:FkbM family methyltransferase n=1 Tax=Dysgonomonas alginatilytica TaxID=1605892 RepID=A0A2V3PV52_9BACT|nr:hypothetical protein [Dysgonomonas alginatilytica]PXV68786.1 hypothetical protein CLV62_10149 [Dysgonomonas alginatilytica]